jgi:predicted O-linked N-acetylglucosamine transferase (SPINDLY family)
MLKKLLIILRDFILECVLFIIDIDYYIQLNYYSNIEYAEKYAEFCFQLRKYEKSTLIYKNIIKKGRINTDILIRIANAEFKNGRVFDSLKYFERAIQLNPNCIQVNINYGKALYRLGRSDLAFKYLSKIYNTDIVDFEVFEMLHICGAYNGNLSFILENSKNIQNNIYKIRKNYSFNYENHAKLSEHNPTLGIHCSFFNSKGVEIFFLPILREIDSDFFNIVLYGNGISNELRNQYKCVNLSLFSDDEFVTKVKSDSIDILVDIDGMGSRITRVGRVAPVQICYFNYPCTTGSDYMDYFLADRISIPEENTKYFTEKILYLNTSVMSFKYQEDWTRINVTPYFKNGYIVYGFFGNPEKFNPALIQAWGDILKNVPNSKLLLVHPLFKTEQIIEHFKGMFNEYGCSSDSLLFVRGKSHDKLLSYYNQIDIALDPFPYNGGHTTMECINLGVPIISFVGESYPGRHGIDFFEYLPKTDFLVYSKEEYVQKNIFLGNNPFLLNDLRKQIPKIAKVSRLTNSRHVGSEWNRVLKSIINNV